MEVAEYEVETLRSDAGPSEGIGSADGSILIAVSLAKEKYMGHWLPEAQKNEEFH